MLVKALRLKRPSCVYFMINLYRPAYQAQLTEVGTKNFLEVA